MRRHLSTLAFALVLAGATWFSIAVKSEARRAGALSSPLELGVAPPPLVLPDLAGRAVDLAAVSTGRPLVVVNFWASWCAPCRVELFQLRELYEEHHGHGLEILAVSVDESRESLDEYLQRSPLPFPVLHDADGEVAERFGVTVLPTTVLIDAEGKVRRVVRGFRSYLPTQVERLLEEPEDA